MRSHAGPALPGDDGHYRHVARSEFESVADRPSPALEYEMVCWLVGLERQALEELLARLSDVPPDAAYVSLVMNRHLDLDGDSVLEIEVIFEGESEQGSGEAGLERSGI